MASNSLEQFYWNLEDVCRLEDAHRQLNHDGQGRRALGHITRSGLVMLCAAWEVYVEALIKEAAKVVCNSCDDPSSLPTDVRKKIVQAASSTKDELGALRLAGDGWKSIYVNAAERETDGLNTPKAEQVGLYMRHFLGVENISSAWTIGPDGVNEIVSARGEVAHRGREASYISIAQLGRFKGRIEVTAVETDNFVCTHLKDTLSLSRQPWRRRSVPACPN